MALFLKERPSSRTSRLYLTGSKVGLASTCNLNVPLMASVLKAHDWSIESGIEAIRGLRLPAAQLATQSVALLAFLLYEPVRSYLLSG
jgi:hypothetical protein